MRPPPSGGRAAGLLALITTATVLTGAVPAAATTVPAGPAATTVPAALAAATAATGATIPAAGPPAPTSPRASTLGTAITVTWQQPRTGPPARTFRVYEGDRVVARNTTTSAVLHVPFGSSHTYTVTAIDADGRESARSAPATGRSWLSGVNPECQPTATLPITITAVSPSAVSVAWPPYPLDGDLELRVDGASLGWTPLTSARIGGLTPGTAYSIGLYRYHHCGTTTLDQVGVADVTTPAGPAAPPGAPTGLTVTGRTDSTVRLSWTAPAGRPPARYAVYSGATLVAVGTGTAATVDRLYHATSHRFTVAALDHTGAESAHSPAVGAATETCLAAPPSPAGLTAAALSPSSVRLDWTFDAAAESYTIYDGQTAVATSAYPEVVVSGLPSASRHAYRVSATLARSCGETAPGPAAAVSTPAGPAARPAAPASLAVTGNTPIGSNTRLTLAWSPSASAVSGRSGAEPALRRPPPAVSAVSAAGADPAVGYRVYEGATVVGETATTSLALTVGGATRHTYTVVAVDAAGNESAASPPVSVQAMFLPPP